MAAFTTQSQVEALIARGAHDAGTIPTATQLTTQMDRDADRIRVVLASSGLSGDPTSGSALEGLCVEANTLMTAAWGRTMHENPRADDLETAKWFMERVEGEGGLLAQIVESVATSDDSGVVSGSSGVSTPEFVSDELVRFQGLKF